MRADAALDSSSHCCCLHMVKGKNVMVWDLVPFFSLHVLPPMMSLSTFPGKRKKRHKFSVLLPLKLSIIIYVDLPAENTTGLLLLLSHPFIWNLVIKSCHLASVIFWYQSHFLSKTSGLLLLLFCFCFLSLENHQSTATGNKADQSYETITKRFGLQNENNERR